MKQYPSIPPAAQSPHDLSYVFVKYDGSNIRAEFFKKKGWYKFGSRNQLLHESQPILGEAIPLFKEKYGDDLERIFRTEKSFRCVDSFTVFFEFFGSKSFAGQHIKDDVKTVVLFDVNPNKKGILGPKEFLDYFGGLTVAELLGQRVVDEELVSKVRSGSFSCASNFPIVTEVPEGVICKSGSSHDLRMCKIKTQAYYEELKKRFPNNYEALWE